MKTDKIGKRKNMWINIHKNLSIGGKMTELYKEFKNMDSYESIILFEHFLAQLTKSEQEQIATGC